MPFSRSVNSDNKNKRGPSHVWMELESKRENLILSTAIGKDAGDLALKPTTVDTFFYGMKPRYPAGRGYELYQNQRLGQAFCAFNSYVILRMSCSSWITKRCHLEFPPGSLPKKINTPHHLFDSRNKKNTIWAKWDHKRSRYLKFMTIFGDLV